MTTTALAPATQETVEAIVHRIRGRNAKTVMDAIRNGIDWETIKKQFGHGKWGAEKRRLAEFAGYKSVRSVERQMAVATKIAQKLQCNLAGLEVQLPDLEAQLTAPGLSLAAFETLANADAPLEALESALERVLSGGTVTQKDAKIAVRGEQGKQRLVETHAPTTVRKIVETNNLSAAAVDALIRMTPDEREGIAASGTVYNPVADREVPIADADDSTWIVAQTVSAKELIEGKSPAAFDETGTLAEMWVKLVNTLSPGKRYRILIYERKSA